PPLARLRRRGYRQKRTRRNHFSRLKGTRMHRLFPSRWIFAFALVLGLMNGGPLAAQDFAPAAAQKVDDATRKTIKEKTATLDQPVEFLRSRGLDSLLLAEVEVYQQAAHKIVKHNEFFQKESAAWTIEALDRGLARAEQIMAGIKGKKVSSWLDSAGRSAV